MKPKIGLKTTNIFYKGKDKIDFDVLEIRSDDPDLGFNIKKVLKVKKFLEGKEISMHSQTSRIFSCKNKENNTPEFNEAELNVVKAEIILCKILEIKELIFHLKQEKLNKSEEKRLRELLKFAKNKGIEMIYESNGKFIAKTTLDVLKKFPRLNYNLDLGHLNTAIGNKTLGMNWKEFIEKIKDRTVYIHAHSNNGREDEHVSLDKGTLPWRKILDMLDLNKIRKIIIETKREHIKETKELLENYLDRER